MTISGGWDGSGRAISVDSTFKYVFLGYGTNEKVFYKKGYYTTKVDQRFWDILNSKFEAVDYKNLSNTNNENVVDASTFELIIHFKNQRKRITGAYGLQSDSLNSTLNWLLETCKNLNLEPAKRFAFETSLQNPFKPDVPKNLLFLPPTKVELERTEE